MMSNITTYIFWFDENNAVVRIPYAKWLRIRDGEECVKEFANKTVYIAYAYILLENRKPGYCPRIDGAIYYFDKVGLISERPVYYDLRLDLDEVDVINLCHRRKIKAQKEKNQWKLNSLQIQTVINLITWC